MLAALFTLTIGAASAQTDAKVEQRRLEIDTTADNTLQQLFKEQPAAHDLYDKAAGYAVFTVTKAGFIVSGAGGNGVVIDKQSKKHTYMRLGLGGIGLGVGAQRYALVILFENASHLEKFVKGGWDSSATAEAAAGKEGVAARSSFIDGTAYYQLTEKGLMAHADVSGTRFWVNEDLN
jgi:lipid-binding SYLF domain-containing protein